MAWFRTLGPNLILPLVVSTAHIRSSSECVVPKGFIELACGSDTDWSLIIDRTCQVKIES